MTYNEVKTFVIKFSELRKLSTDSSLKIHKTYGLRTFWALQPNEFKIEPDWADKMFKVEWEVCDKPEFAAI